MRHQRFSYRERRSMDTLVGFSAEPYATAKPAPSRLRGVRQQRLNEFFPVVSGVVQAKQTRNQFRVDRRKRLTQLRAEEREYMETRGVRPTGIHPADLTFGCVTQNVNGFGARACDRDAWFCSLRTHSTHGRSDVTLLQETHVAEADVAKFTDLYASGWGFRTGTHCPTRSFWSPAHEKKAGVAILVDPYGAFTDVSPLFEDQWGAHFMAVQGRIHGHALIIVNVNTLVAVGGDFNCTLDDEADRSYISRTGVHDSPALRGLLATWGIIDPVASARPKHWRHDQLRRHHTETHTYHYPVDGHGEASSRLDRWYVNGRRYAWVAGWEVKAPAVSADHHAAKLHLQQPDDPIRIRKAAKVHPPPSYSEDFVKQHTHSLLQQFLERISVEGVAAREMAKWWDELKQRVVTDTLRSIRERKRTRRNTYRQKIRRLSKQQARLNDGHSATVASITDALDALTLEDVRGSTPAARIRRAIADCQRARSSLHQRRHFAAATHWDGKTTRDFFRRISSKFSDNTIHRLDPLPGAPARGVHGKANILADAWCPILQQTAPNAASQDDVAGWIEEVTHPTSEQEAIVTEITTAEIEAAFAACKMGRHLAPIVFAIAGIAHMPIN
ncbi:hypothetical protein ON010_g3826 [Phytophthora cinnamomi]|nr:hypothetical protein ON010_g3826 [Phytophthora cinnamomi]